MLWNAAKTQGIQAKCISPKDFADREEFHKALLKELQENQVDLVVLAGYLVAIPPMIVEAYPNRIINIHPSLIPSFCGTGYYGLKVHEGVLARGVKGDRGDGTFCGHRHRYRTDHSSEGCGSAAWRYSGQILQKRVMEEARMEDTAGCD